MQTISFHITPSNSELSWSPMIAYHSLGKVQKDIDFHTITISEIPLKKEGIQIKISGFTYETICLGKEFNKLKK